jgi:pyridoxal 5'-phosphate synthase pdxS subunit
VSATSSAAGPGHQAPRPGGGRAGDARAAGPVPVAQGVEVSAGTAVNAPATGAAAAVTGTARVKRGMADMLKGGVIMDVVTPEQAKIAEDAGAVAVMALERVPADIRAGGGVARMSDPDVIEAIIGAVSVPVMAKCRIGHFAEAQVLQAIGVDYVDESEVLTPADAGHHVDKWAFTVPFVCGATGLGEALRRVAEGAAMIRSKGEAGTGNVVEATRHMRQIAGGIRRLGALRGAELFAAAKELQAPYELVAEVARAGQLPVVLFTAGGIATPADAALMMQLGAEGVFVGSGIFKSGDPARRAAAIVKATTFHDDPDVVAKVSRGLGEAMAGLSTDTLAPAERYAGRGW